MKKDPNSKHYIIQCFQGLIQEANIAEYALSVYSYISNTKYKYIVVKHEGHAVIKGMASIPQVQQSSAIVGTFGASNQAQTAQMQMLGQLLATEQSEIKLLLQSLHQLHTQTLLNPFYQPDYATHDDGTDYSVFTQLQDEPEEHSATTLVQALKGEIDAVEDLILDDFSFDDANSEGSLGEEDEIRERSSSIDIRSSSVDSNFSRASSFNIRRQKGK